MAKLDANALLKANPQVDRELLDEFARKIQEARKFIGKKAEQPLAPPYGGRRIISDEAASSARVPVLFDGIPSK